MWKVKKQQLLHHKKCTCSQYHEHPSIPVREEHDCIGPNSHFFWSCFEWFFFQAEGDNQKEPFWGHGRHSDCHNDRDEPPRRILTSEHRENDRKVHYLKMIIFMGKLCILLLEEEKNCLWHQSLYFSETFRMCT